MVEALESLGPGEGLVLCVPPRHSKTVTVSAWLEWCIGQSPTSDAIYASYGVDLARRSSRAIRNELLYGQAMRSYFPAVTLSEDSQSVTDWATVHGGQFRAAGVGGGLTGMGARYAVVDDPFKDRREADSLLKQESIWEWFTQVLLTRLTPDARLVVMHTRWSEGDLAGRIMTALEAGETDDLGGLKWKVVELRGLAEEDDVLARFPGEALWPTRYNAAKLQAFNKADPYGFAALYQQRPRPREDKVFGPAFFYRELPATKLRYGRGIDLAYTKSSRANHSAAYQVGALGDRFYVLHGERWQDVIGESIQRLKALQSRFGGKARIESNGPQKGIFDTLQIAGLQVEGFTPVGDKYARALPLIEAWNDGRVLLPSPDAFPASRAWVTTLISVIERFTGSGNESDDDIDALGNAIVQILEGGNNAAGTLAKLKVKINEADEW